MWEITSPLTVMKLDDELRECIDMPADSMGLKQL